MWFYITQIVFLEYFKIQFIWSTSTYYGIIAVLKNFGKYQEGFSFTINIFGYFDFHQTPLIMMLSRTFTIRAATLIVNPL